MLDKPNQTTIHTLFEVQATRTPDAIAVTFEGKPLTYGELNRRANVLAHYLTRLGVGLETPVGICVERSLEMIVGLLGVLKAGGAYVPLDPTYPRERLAFMLEDTRVPVLLTQARLLDLLPQKDARAVCLDADWDTIEQSPGENPAPKGTAESLAYIMYTSGSEGKPKGVMVLHGAVIGLVVNTNYVEFSPSDIVAQASNCSFDASTFEIWGALLNGAQLVGVMKDVALSPRDLAAQLRDAKISVLFMTPALFNQMARDAPSAFRSVRYLILGGEAPDPRWVREVLLSGPPGQLVNGYGPTETTTFASYYVVQSLPDNATAIPIGRAVSGAQLYVLDAQMNEVPAETEGELYIGGAGLARGYLNRPELTAERFVSSPFSQARGSESDRLYKTGDLVRRRADGEIEFIGRADQQVKVRGLRIELGEIEATLSTHPAVNTSVVIVREDIPGDKRLAAYIVPKEGSLAGNPTQEDLASRLAPELRAHIAKTLPEYMVPASYVWIDALPLTPNGKVDRRALPAPGKARPLMSESFAGPRNPVEEQLAGIFAQVLGIERVGVNDDFLDLGGHSLVAAQIVSKMNDSLGVDLPVRTIFEATTVAQLASSVETVRHEDPATKAPRVQKASRDRNLPLSYAQQQLWILAQLDPNSHAYNEPLSFDLPGAVDAAVLERSINEIIRRHEVWRTTFELVDGQPAQVIRPSAPLTLNRVDLRSLPPASRDTEAIRLAAEDARRPFNLQTGPLLRAFLIRLDDASYRLSFTLHHITAERVSMYSVFLPELYAIYTAFSAKKPSPLPELPIQYADFALWQRQWLRAEMLAPQLEYWKQRLGHNLPALQLPMAKPRSSAQSFRGARVPIKLTTRIAEGLKALSQRESVTLFMTLAAAFKTLLYRYTGQTDMVIGTVNAARNRPETEPLIGLFLNTLVLRTDMANDPTFHDFLKQIRDVTLGAYAHSELPFEMLVEELHPARNAGQNPLFQVAFAFHPPAPIIEAGWTVSEQDVDTGTAKFDLTLFLDETADNIIGSFEYNTDLFDEAPIARLVEHFKTLLEGIIESPGQRLSELPLLTPSERRSLVAWNETRAEYPADASIPSLFEAQVERSPDAVALIAGEEQLTYRALNARANQLARRLRARGVDSETKVAICVERSAEMVLAILGVLKAGGAYVPMDPAYPKARLSFMLEDTGAPVLLTQSSLLSLLPETSAQILPLDAERPFLEKESEQNLDSGVRPEHAAYLIYTSGSTGKPKGVVIEHRNAVAFLSAAASVFTPEDLEGTLAGASICFDLSILELFLPLCHGGSVILARNVLAIHELPSKGRVTLLSAVPSAMGALLDMGGIPPSVRTVILAGEPLRQSLSDEVHKLDHVRKLYNIYGPTECTTYSTIAAVNPGETPTIGRPIPNTRLYVLNRGMKPVPVGVPGELYIGGAGVARGYLNRPELTAERFLASPWKEGERLYKTGDLVRLRPDGEVEFLGRIDEQVKLRGFRIELGEIEAALSQHPLVREAAVLKAEDTPGDAHLVAYIAPEPQADRAEMGALLKSHLGGLLPSYMVPSAFVFLSELPKTQSGKIDRRALPAEGQRTQVTRGYVAPKDSMEILIANVWKQVLQHAEVSVHDNFFDLGGNSLRLARAYGALRGAVNKPFTMIDLFKFPTIRSLAQFFTEAPVAPPSFARVQDRAQKQKLAIERQKQRMQAKRKINE